MTDENTKETVGLKSEIWLAMLAESSRIRCNCNINAWSFKWFQE